MFNRPVTQAIIETLEANEPPDGSHLIVQDWSGYMMIIWRDDRNSFGNCRWFHSPNFDPITIAEALKNSMAVYALGARLAGIGSEI